MFVKIFKAYILRHYISENLKGLLNEYMPNKESFLWDFCKYFDKKGVGTDGRLL